MNQPSKYHAYTIHAHGMDELEQQSGNVGPRAGLVLMEGQKKKKKMAQRARLDFLFQLPQVYVS